MSTNNAETIHVQIVSNTSQVFSGDVRFMVVPTCCGEVGIYPGHEPLMSLVEPGALRLLLPDQEERVVMAISGGVLEVHRNIATILADEVVRSHALDFERAKKVRDAVSRQGSCEHKQEELDKALAELKALSYLRIHKN